MKNKKSKIILILILTVISVLFIAPIVIVFMNSFKSKLFINSTPFAFPNADSFVGLANYGEGMIKTGFLQAFFITLFITVASVFLIVVLTSMTAWYLVRVKSRFTKVMYYLFAFAMIVPFQMVMFTGFIKSIPVSLEEAAMIDGCSIMQIYFKIVFPVIRPIIMTVAILNAMWIWNDYLLPYLVIGSEYKTISVAIQYLRGGYGSIDLGLMMSMLVLAIIPIVIFYMICQKWIIQGVIAGAVKG